MADLLTLKAGGRALAGWTEIAVTRRLEGLPNNFEISATQSSPSLPDAKGIKAGDTCSVLLGADVVLTGYIDDVVVGYGAGEHTAQVSGRGKCADLVDCAAIWKGCQVSGANAYEIALKLANPYGVAVNLVGDPGPVVPQFNINLGDSPQSVLELITRHAQLLYYEGADGSLILSELGSERAAGGIVEGVNVQQARLVRSMASRYSDYLCVWLSLDTSGLFQDTDGLNFSTSKDPNVARLRRMVIVAGDIQGSNVLAQKRAEWEASRRAGRGSILAVTVDSWRDAGGNLWAPNTLAAISLPHLGLTKATWCISEVTYRLSEKDGTTADLLLMPQEAFLPEPIILQPILGGLT